MRRDVADLSNVKGTYTKALQSHMKEINEAYNDGASLEELKILIKEFTKDTAVTPAQMTFLSNLEKQTTRDNLLLFVSNTWLRGCGLGADINDRFNWGKAKRKD